MPATPRNTPVSEDLWQLQVIKAQRDDSTQQASPVRIRGRRPAPPREALRLRLWGCAPGPRNRLEDLLPRAQKSQGQGPVGGPGDRPPSSRARMREWGRRKATLLSVLWGARCLGRGRPASVPEKSQSGLPRGDGGLTFSLHAHHQALLVAAVLTAIPLTLVNEAVLVIPACVHEVLAYGSLEEAFAAFTAIHTIVLSCSQEKAREKKMNAAETVLVFVWIFHSQEPPGSPPRDTGTSPGPGEGTAKSNRQRRQA